MIGDKNEINFLKERLQKLIQRAPLMAKEVGSEEGTKQSLITPFIYLLGYDVHDPFEVKMEMEADLESRIKKHEKIDYAIMNFHRPMILIEAKSVRERIDNHTGQLGRYFQSVNGVRLGVLTNGLEYAFFSDLKRENIMDDQPFYRFSILELKDIDYQFIYLLTKDVFQEELFLKEAVKYAEREGFIFSYSRKLKERTKKGGRPKVIDAVRRTFTIDGEVDNALNEYIRKDNNASGLVRELLREYFEERGLLEKDSG